MNEEENLDHGDLSLDERDYDGELPEIEIIEGEDG